MGGLGMTNELYHYGIKNQRWGTRRFQYEDGTLTPEGKERYRKYSESQRAQDRRMYSKGAEKRIEKRISEGEGIKGARSEEANRIERYREASKTNAKIGKVVGAAGFGAAAVAGELYVKNILKSQVVTDNTINRFIKNNSKAFNLGVNIAGPAIIVAAAATGREIGGKVGKGGTMMVGGYKPEQSR